MRATRREREGVQQHVQCAVHNAFLGAGICKTLFEIGLIRTLCSTLCSRPKWQAGRHKPKVLECSDAVASCAQFSICDTWQGSSRAKKKTMHGRQKPELKRRLGQAKQPQPPPQLKSLEAAAVAIHRRREREDFSWVLHTFQTRVYSFQ